MPGFFGLLAAGLLASTGAVAPAKVLGAGEESSLEVPGVRSRQRTGARLMRQEVPASELQAAEYPVETEGESVAAFTTCAPIMKVSKDWTVSDKHAMRTGIYRMQRQKQSDGSPIYKNEMGMYLYYWNITSEWRIGWDFNRPHAGVSTPPSASVCPDLAPEWWAFVNGSWTTREGFQVLPEICAPVVTVSGAEQTLPQLMGQYSMALNCSVCPNGFNGGCPCRPVYKSTRNYAHGSWTYYLFFWFEFGEWRIGTDINASAAAVTSLEGENKPCPAQASGWETFVDFKWQPNSDLIVQRKSAKGSIYDDFQVGSSNTNECPEFTTRMNESRCESVAEDLEKDWGGQTEDEDKPSGCYEAHGVMGKVYYNSAEAGAANMDAYPVCERTEEYWNHALNTAFKPSTTNIPTMEHKEVAMHDSERWYDEQKGASGASEASHASGTEAASHGSHASAPEVQNAEVSAASVASAASAASGSASIAASATSGASATGSSSDAHGSHGSVADREVEEEEAETSKGKGGKFIILAIAMIVVLVMFLWWRRNKKAGEAAKDQKPAVAAAAGEKPPTQSAPAGAAAAPAHA